MWHHLADIESDMSALHRVDDIWSMPAQRFFKLAWRLPAYRGVMRERVMADQRENEQANPTAPPVESYESAPSASQRRVVPATRAVLESNPAFAGIFAFGSTSGG